MLRTSIGSSTRDSRSSGYQTLDFEDPPDEGNGEQQEEEEDEAEKEEEGGLIGVSQSQLSEDNSNSSEGEGKDDSEYSGEESGEIEDSVVRENRNDGDRGDDGDKGKDGDRGEDGDRSEGMRENGKGEGQGTLGLPSVRKYQRAATRPPPGTVKNLMAKFQ